MIDQTWYRRTSGLPQRTSAGGVVVRSAGGEVLVALVKEEDANDYVLPKGGVEPEEELEQAAHREIEEEAGLSALELLGKLGVRERLDFRKRCWTTTHYYLFRTRQVDGQPSDASHDYQMAWFPLAALPRMFWPEQRELIEANREKIVAMITNNHHDD